MLPLLPFLSATSTALLKPGGFLKSQMPSPNAEKHLQRHTVPKKTTRTISLLVDIRTSTVISKAKAKSWQKTCSSLSPKTRPSEVFSLLRSISGSHSPTSSDLPNFPNCHTPVDCANHLSSRLQSHFSTQIPKLFRSTEKAQMNLMRTAHCNTLHSTFCHHSSSFELSTAISQLSTATPSGPDQLLSSNPPPTISVTFFSIYLQLFLVNTHLSIYLETINNHPHSQIRKTL